VTNSLGVAGLLSQDLSATRSSSLRPRRLATPVIEDFVDQIVSGNIPPGTDLPSEASICSYLGISRTVLREVLKVLEQKGLVRVENGKGTSTTEQDDWKLLDPVVLAARLRHDGDFSFRDHIVSVRIALEAEMALVGNPEQLDDVAKKIGALRSSISDQERYFEADREFHDSVMRASGNQAGRAIVLSIYHEAQPKIDYKVGDARLEESLRGHIAIFEAIAAHDPVRAADAAREHIVGGWRRRISKGVPRRTTPASDSKNSTI
jgi:DNA-binding FadR family transcriptional regulator